MRFKILVCQEEEDDRLFVLSVLSLLSLDEIQLFAESWKLRSGAEAVSRKTGRDKIKYSKVLNNWQCDQMAWLFVKYLGIYSNVNLPKSFKKFQE